MQILQILEVSKDKNQQDYATTESGENLFPRKRGMTLTAGHYALVVEETKTQRYKKDDMGQVVVINGVKQLEDDAAGRTSKKITATFADLTAAIKAKNAALIIGVQEKKILAELGVVEVAFNPAAAKAGVIV